MVTSKGYNDIEGKDLRTATMRYPLGDILAKTAVVIEQIDPQVFEIYNEFWVTFFEDGRLLERKFIFGPFTIDANFLEPIPVISQKGIPVK